MTTERPDQKVEDFLHHTYSIDFVSDTRRSIDRRVGAAVASERRYRQTAPRRLLLVRTPRMLGGLAAAMLLLAATAVAGGTLFNQLITGAPLLENVWDRATDVGLSVTDAGYTVTLEKVAVDSDRLWVALSVSSESGSASIWDMRVTDAAGVAFTGGTGAGTGEVGGQSATLFGFQVPDGVTPTGPFVLEVTALGHDATGEAGERIAGTWRFTFDVSQTPSWSRPPAQLTPASLGS